MFLDCLCTDLSGRLNSSSTQPANLDSPFWNERTATAGGMSSQLGTPIMKHKSSKAKDELQST